jgi:hypothetical protein
MTTRTIKATRKKTSLTDQERKEHVCHYGPVDSIPLHSKRHSKTNVELFAQQIRQAVTQQVIAVHRMLAGKDRYAERLGQR